MATVQSRVADGFCVGKKIRQLAGVKVFLSSHAPGEQLQAAPVEPPVQVGEKRKRLGAKDLGLPAAGLGVDLDAGYSRVRCHEGLRKGVRSRTYVLDLFVRLWGGAVAVRRSAAWIRPRDRLPCQESVRARTAA